jgi:hypothetical protein
MPPSTPRLAGRRLKAIARALSSPVGGATIARLVIHQMGLDQLRGIELSDAEVRPVVGFRAGPPAPGRRGEQ